MAAEDVIPTPVSSGTTDFPNAPQGGTRALPPGFTELRAPGHALPPGFTELTPPSQATPAAPAQPSSVSPVSPPAVQRPTPAGLQGVPDQDIVSRQGVPGQLIGQAAAETMGTIQHAAEMLPTKENVKAALKDWYDKPAAELESIPLAVRSAVHAAIDRHHENTAREHARVTEDQEIAKTAQELTKQGKFGEAAKLLQNHTLVRTAQSLDESPGGWLGHRLNETVAQPVANALKNQDYGTAGVKLATFLVPFLLGTGELKAGEEATTEFGKLQGDMTAALKDYAEARGPAAAQAAAPKPGILRPGFETVPGAPEAVPARATGTVARTAEGFMTPAQRANLQAYNVTETQAVARRNIAAVTAKAADLENVAATAHKGDAFGFIGGRDALQDLHQPTFKLIDELSGGDFTKAQREAKTALAQKDYVAYQTAVDKQEALFDYAKWRDNIEVAKNPEMAERLSENALAEAKAGWKTSIGLDELDSQFRTVIHPAPTDVVKKLGYDPGMIDAKAFGEKLTDAIQQNSKLGERSSFAKAGFTPEHIKTLEDLSVIMKEQSVKSEDALMGLVRKLSLSYGGTEWLAGKITSAMMTHPKWTEAFVAALRSKLPSGAVAQSMADLFRSESGELKIPFTGKGGAPEQKLSSKVAPFADDVIAAIRGGKKTDTAYEYNPTGPSNMQHMVTTKSPELSNLEGGLVGHLAAQDTVPGTVTVRSNQIYDSRLRGMGLGKAQLQKLFDEAGPDVKFVKSDVSTTGAARNVWTAMEQKYPDAVTKEIVGKGADARPVWTADLEKIRQSEQIQATHYSATPGIETLQPGKVGTGKAGAEMARAGEPGFVPRTNFGIEGEYKEPRIQALPHKYPVTFKASEIYDADKDPKGLFKNAAAADVDEAGNSAATNAERSVREAGFKGYKRAGNVISFEPTSTLPPVDAIADYHNKNRGFTYNMEQGFVRNKPVFSVAGGYPELEQTIPGKKLTADEVKQYLDDPRVKEALKNPKNSIGGWFDGKGSHLEVSTLYNDRDEAIAAGKKLNQQSIYDHANRAEIPTGGTGVAPAAPAAPSAKLNREGLSSAKYETPQGGQEVGTLRSTTIKNGELTDMTNDPSRVYGMDAINEAEKQRPGYKVDLLKTIASYKNSGLKLTRAEIMANPDKALAKVVKHYADNYEFLYNQIPPEIKEAAVKWYRSANALTKADATKYGLSNEQAAGVYALLSPQNAWENNVELAKRMLDIYHNKQNFEFSPKMYVKTADLRGASADVDRALEAIQGKKFNELDDVAREQMWMKGGKTKPEVVDDQKVAQVLKGMWIRLYDEAENVRSQTRYAPSGEALGTVMNESGKPATNSWLGLDALGKVVSVLDDGSIDNIHHQLGFNHKVRNFYNNIVNPWSDAGHTTVDTHHIGAGWLSPLGSKEDRVLHAFGNSNPGHPGAPKHGPVGLQGTSALHAEATRQVAARHDMLPNEMQSVLWEGKKSLFDKMPEGAEAKIKATWKKVHDGELSPERARKQIVKDAGGFKPPAWLPEGFKK